MSREDGSVSRWFEPLEGEIAGLVAFRRPKLPYDYFMEAEGIPIYRGIGANQIQDLPLAPWKRLGGRGTYIQLFGTEGLWGLYAVEIPVAGALNPEKHLYEEIVFVVEGCGATEVWHDGQAQRHFFEWQKGSLFAIPLNASHRLFNTGSAPALLLCATSAPNMMNLFNDCDFIFDCPFSFPDRLSGQAHFRAGQEIETEPVRELAIQRTNFIPDIINVELPVANRRSPGYRMLEPRMGGSRFYCWIAQHESGRYSKAHKHASSAVLLCIKGKGYTHTWPDKLGPTPWASGYGAKVLRQDYEYGGIVSAAPMSGDWFHQHFGVASDPLRLLVWHGPNNHRAHKAGIPGEKLRNDAVIDLDEGGSAIPYHQEDPAVRAAFSEALSREGVVSGMRPEFYQRARFASG